jgi:hypothetical protein
MATAVGDRYLLSLILRDSTIRPLLEPTPPAEAGGVVEGAFRRKWRRFGCAPLHTRLSCIPWLGRLQLGVLEFAWFQLVGFQSNRFCCQNNIVAALK